jgi:hypothetical protein
MWALSEYFQVAIDDASRLANFALLPDEMEESAVRFVNDALTSLATYARPPGVQIKRGARYRAMPGGKGGRCQRLCILSSAAVISRRAWTELPEARLHDPWRQVACSGSTSLVSGMNVPNVTGRPLLEYQGLGHGIGRIATSCRSAYATDRSAGDRDLCV